MNHTFHEIYSRTVSSNPGTVCSKKLLVCSASKSVRQNIRLYEAFPSNSSTIIIGNCSWRWNWIVLSRLHNSKYACFGNLVCHSLGSLLRQWRVHSHLSRGLYYLVKETTGKILGMGENQADLRLVSIAIGMDTASVHGEHTTLSRTLLVRELVIHEGWYRNSPLHNSVCALPQLFMYFSIFHSLL